jgi:cytidine deaminase
MKPAATLGKLLPLTEYPAIVQKMASEAVRVSAHAYAPYSLFTVGAALLHDEDHSITVGCNYENCVYQSSCAERCAILTANAQGKRRASAIAVYGRSINPVVPQPPASGLCTPCGVCRQFLVEVSQLSELDMDVVLVSFDTLHAKIVKLSTLLPENFGPKDLGMDVTQWSRGNSTATTPCKKRARDDSGTTKSAASTPLSAQKGTPPANTS